MTFGFSIKGMQEAQRDNQRQIRAIRPRNAVQKALVFIIAGGLRAAIIRTPVDTGSWRASHRAHVQLFNVYEAVVSIDPISVNPKSGTRPADYAEILHPRGDKYQVYDQVVAYEGERLLRGGTRIIEQETFGGRF